MSFSFEIEVKWMQGKWLGDFINEITDTEVIHVSPVNNLDDKADLQHVSNWTIKCDAKCNVSPSTSAASHQSRNRFID